MMHHQKQLVDQIKNPPRYSGSRWATRNNRSEGYADYRIGKFYVSCEPEVLVPRGADDERSGLLFAIGYDRVVYGDHGPYVEFSDGHIQWSAFSSAMASVQREHFEERPLGRGGSRREEAGGEDAGSATWAAQPMGSHGPRGAGSRARKAERHHAIT